MIFTHQQRVRTAEGFSVYKMALLKVGLLTLQGMVGVYLSSTMKWSAMDMDDKIMLFAGMFMAASATVLSFIDKSLSRIADEQKQITKSNP